MSFRSLVYRKLYFGLSRGFGRLIRTKNDKGIVVILDPRIKTRSYGKAFLRSLPDCKIVEE